MKLSILVCSTNNRYDNFAIKIQNQLFSQWAELSESERDQVEILVLTDNKKTMLGDKRNRMVELAQGDYVVFIDDDDRVSDEYVRKLLDATESGCDAITFNALVTINGGEAKLCKYSTEFGHDYNTDDFYARIPNHICCVKRELALEVSFPSILYGEDSGYSKVLIRKLKSQYRIDEVLYYYDYNQTTTETQTHKRSRVVKRPNVTPIVDVIFLSNASRQRLRTMTQTAINSCLAGANSLPVNIVVLEQNPRVIYDNAHTIHIDDEFNYNAFANRGAALGSAEWIMIANNDLIFENGWLHALLAVDHPVVSPKEPNDIRQYDIHENTCGTQVGRHFSGWCFMISRELWTAIGGFDERLKFWGADDIVVEQVLRHHVQPMLVTDSVVKHLGSVTLRSQNKEKTDELTWEQIDILVNLLGSHRLQDHPEYIKWKAAHEAAKV